MKRITIIGGGASGTLLAVNLLKNADEQPIEINLVEKSRKVGRGVAYSTADDVHLLNVPAGKMGAFPDDIEHFQKWLTVNNYDYAPTDFVPRKIYGEYLREVFADAIAARHPNTTLNLLDDEAIDIISDEDSALVLLKSGEALPSSKVVLAFGNFLPPNLPTASSDYATSEKYFHNAWNAENLEKIAPDEDVLVIGTGLTAVDNILSLYHKNHTGKITAISKHGWFPAVHQAAKPYECFKDEIAAQDKISGIFKTIRRHCRRAENWRSVIDVLRPITLRRVWDVSRHRMPPKCAEILQQMIVQGRLEVKSGKITDIQMNGGKFEVKYKGKKGENVIKSDSVINCIGSESNFGKLDFPLVRSLLERGEIKPDELFLGLDATPDGKIINCENKPSKVISTLGTALKGILWESTAMPEIRLQARNLASRLLADELKPDRVF
jgi:uncharacterized NAD(P)/FAD-binding protein YdhS